MSSYELEHHDAPDERMAHVSVSGELDLTNARDLEEQLRELAPNGLLVLDVNRVVFVDSAGLNAIFKLARRRGPDGIGLVFDETAPIARALAIVGIDQVARTGSSIEELGGSPALG